jgi:hypothetical protein
MSPKVTTGKLSSFSLILLAHIFRLLDLKTQESFYTKIVARYMQFCSANSKDLDSAFASLTLTDPTSSDRSLEPGESRPLTPSPPKTASAQWGTSPPQELQLILTALRKLREGLLGSSATAPSPVFAQRVHVFNIRLAILAHSWESYLLSKLHTRAHPLPHTELVEMTSYLILDLATRQDSLGGAFALRHNSKVRFGYENRHVNTVLRAIMTNDWVAFWRIRRKVDGYLRAMLYWHAEKLRKISLKAIGRSYLSCDVKYILASTSGGEMSWDELVKAEDVGWQLEGEKVIIRKPKAR